MDCQRQPQTAARSRYVLVGENKYYATMFDGFHKAWELTPKYLSRNPFLWFSKDDLDKNTTRITKEAYQKVDSYDIKYNDKITLNAQGETILRDLGNSPEENAQCFGSNAVALPGDAYVDLEIVHQLGSDELNTALPTSVNSDEITSFSTGASDSFDLAVTTIGTSGDYPRIYKATTNDISVGTVVEVSFDAVVNSGNCILTSIELGGTTVVNLQIVTGTNSFKATYTALQDRARMRFNGTNLFDIEVTNTSIKEVTTNNSYFTHTDPATQEVHDVTFPTSTTYKMENDFSNAFATDKVVTEADRVLIKANPNGVINMWLTDTNPLGFSFEKVNIKHYYVGNEGTGDKIYNITSSAYATIQSFTASCRDTYLNRNIGLTNLLLSQDANGRPTGITPVTTGNGKHIIFPMLPTPYDYTAPMCFKDAHGDTTALTLTHCDDTTEVI